MSGWFVATGTVEGDLRIKTVCGVSNGHNNR